MIIPVSSLTNPGTQNLEQIDKSENGEIWRKKLMGVRYIPLTDKDVQWAGDWRYGKKLFFVLKNQ